MKSLNTHGDLEILAPDGNSDVSPSWQKRICEYILRFVVIAAGVFLGAFIALVIGLFTGWIEISC